LHYGNASITIIVVSWDVYFTELAEQWLLDLDEDDYEAIMAPIELLEEKGPASAGPPSTALRARVTTT
jgi:hypothetical protein